MSQELTWKVTIDPAIAVRAMRDLVSGVNSGNKEITDSVNRQAKAAISAANQEFKEIQAIHAAKVRMAEQESRQIQAIHAAKARQAESEAQRDLREIQQIHAAKVRMAEREAAQRAQAEQRASRQVTAEIRRFERERQQIAAQNARAIEALAKSEADTRIREGKRAANEIIASLNRERQTAAQGRSRVGAFAAGAVGGIAALVGLSAANEIRQAASAWIDYASKLESTRIAFTQMIGSAELAEQHLKELQAFALKTPFQFSDLIDASQRMQALGFQAEQVIPILTDVGNAVAAAGGGAERLDRVILAISQIQSKGKLATQEMNQLAESGIPAWKILTDQLGKSRAELVKMVEQGKISSQVFLDAFQKFSQQNFGGLMEQQSKTFTGAMSNIKDALLQTSATAFEPLYERLSKSAQAMSEMATNSKEFRDDMKSAGTQIITVWDGVVEAFYVLRDVIGLVSAVAVSVFGLWTNAILGTYAAVKALYLANKGLAQFLIGDLRGAAESLAHAENQARISTESFSEALRTQGAVAQWAAQMWEDAAARTTRATLAMAQAGFGVAQGIDTQNLLGAGITRQKSIGIGSGGSGGASAASKISAGQQLLNQLTTEYNRLQDEVNKRTKLQIVLLDEKFAKATPGERRLIEAKAREIEATEKTITADKKKADATQLIRNLLEQQTEAIKDARDGDDQWADEIEKLEAQLKKLGLTMDANTKKLLTDNAATLKAISLTRERIALEETRIKRMERQRAVEQENQDRLLGIERSDPNATRPLIADPIAAAAAVAKAAHDAQIVQLTQQLSAVNLLGDAYSNLASAIGQGVGAIIQDFVLLGTVGPGAFKKVLAAALATVAAQAGAQAIYELALGFAALTPWGAAIYGPAPLHFKAAALLGSIALITGAAGRLTAGNSFQQSSGSVAGSAFASATSPPKAELKPQDINRRNAGSFAPQLAGQPLRAEITLKLANGLHQVIEGSVVENWTTNGRIRTVIQSDGQG